MNHRRRGWFSFVAVFWIGVAPAAAQILDQNTPSPDDAVAALRQEIAALKQDYEQRMAALEERLAALSPAPSAPEPQVAVAPAPNPETRTPVSSTYFNPNISVIGNFLAVGGSNRTENLPSADLRESEVGLQAIVDPYGRADFFLAFGEEGVEIEEGYLTFTALPAGLLAKVGRMRTTFGKANTLHLHTLPWPDQPLPITNLLGEEGWIGTGASVSRLVPLPAGIFSELTVQAFRGDAEDLFAGERRSDLAYNGHYRLFRDLTDSTNLDLGLSYGYGPNSGLDGGEPDGHTRLQAVDATFRWKPLSTALYRSATFRGELFRSRREPLPEEAIGWYLSGDYQFARRWSAGARFEASDRAEDPSLRDTGRALLLTFSPSEFSQLRGELRRREYAEGETADEFLLQLQFAIGAHGAHPF